MNLLNPLNIFGFNKQEKPTEKAEDAKSVDPVESFEFGPMKLSKKFIFMEKKATYCIVPPTPIMPGRTLLLYEM